MAHLHVTHDSLLSDASLIHMYVCFWCAVHHLCRLPVASVWDKTHWYVWHDSSTRETWLIHVYVCVVTSSTSLVSSTCSSTVRHDSVLCVTWLFYTWDMTYSHVCMRHAVQYITCVSSSCVRHDSWICVTWLIYTQDITHSRVCTRRDVHYLSCVMYLCVTWLTHMNKSHYTHMK